MRRQPEIALLISTYQRPGHLSRCLLSIGLQRDVSDQMEVVVTDDGSTDETADVVKQFARTTPFPVQFTTHPHKTFQLARCRNEGVAASSAPYILFLDGDCVLPPDHVRQHLLRRKRGVTVGGDCCRLDEPTSARVTDATIRSGEFQQWVPHAERRRLATQHRKAWFYSLLRHPRKPKLIGNNIALWREDYERINGYDERFEGWGCEDDDLRLRLRQAGVRIESILNRTFTYHLWHRVDVTAPKIWREGSNVRYIKRRARLTRCLNGLRKRNLCDISMRLVGTPAQPEAVRRLLAKHQFSVGGNGAEVEVLCLPGKGGFSGRADCNLLVLMDNANAPRRILRQADIVLAKESKTRTDGRRIFQFAEFDRALREAA